MKGGYASRFSRGVAAGGIVVASEVVTTGRVVATSGMILWEIVRAVRAIGVDGKGVGGARL